MSAWDDYAREASVGEAYTPPDIQPDLYDAIVAAVGEPTTTADPFNADRLRTTFWVDWQIADDVTLRQWVTLPEGFLTAGVLSEKATLYQVADSLGFVRDGRVVVNPPAWVGLPARVMVELRPTASGEQRPRITRVMPPRQTAPAPSSTRTTSAPARPQQAASRPAARADWPPRG